LIVASALLPFQALAQPMAPADEPDSALRRSLFVGWHAYREPALGMRLDGPAVGLGVSWAPVTLQGGAVDFEGELGTVDYRSRDSGDMEGARRFRTASALWLGRASVGPWPRPGVGLTTEWTDLRGLTTTGAAGYERFNRSLWLLGQWHMNLFAQGERPATFQAGVLMAGWHDSYLSQAGRYSDVTNRQRRGLSLAVDAPWEYEGIKLSLGLRVQRYSDSDRAVSAGLGSVYEPANRSVDIRLSVQY
jgi:hypothetical protein